MVRPGSPASRVGAIPRDVTIHVDRHAVTDRVASEQNVLGGVGRFHPWGARKFGLGESSAGIEVAIEASRNVFRTLRKET